MRRERPKAARSLRGGTESVTRQKVRISDDKPTPLDVNSTSTPSPNTRSHHRISDYKQPPSNTSFEMKNPMEAGRPSGQMCLSHTIKAPCGKHCES